VERDFAKCDDILSKVECKPVSFIGPKGAGKTRTLKETYYRAKARNLLAYYIDVHTFDSEWKCPSSAIVFVDNAQALRNTKAAVAIGNASKVVYAYSPTLYDDEKGGISYLNNVIGHHSYLISFLPFSPMELAEFIEKNYNGRIYSNPTTLPSIVLKVLNGMNYTDLIVTNLEHLLCKAVRRLKNYRDETVVRVLKSLFSLCFKDTLDTLEENPSVYMPLKLFGLIYLDSDHKAHFVYEKKYLVQSLVNTASVEHELMMQFDIGAAKELLFHYLCYNTIQITCYGDNGHSITGRTNEDRVKNITCTEFVFQNGIGSKVDTPSNACYLIKLEQRHFAIDFLIFDKSQGTSSSKVLYFIQVSSVRYSDRDQDKKFSAVKTKTRQLDDKTPLEYYHNQFGVQKRNCFYVFSTPSTPTSKSFSKIEQEQNRIYFHRLLI